MKGALVILAFALLAFAIVLRANFWEQAIVATEVSLRKGERTGELQSRQVFVDNDPYLWVANAQRMVTEPILRVRDTDADNTPDGRPMHWSQSMAWLLVVAGAIASMSVGTDLPSAIEAASIFVNPSVLVIFLSIGYFLLHRHCGSLVTLLLLAGLAGTPLIAGDFHSHRPDHQSLHFCFLVFALLLTMVGFERAHDSKRASIFLFWGAGICVGLGFWVGATVQMLFMIPFIASWAILARLTMRAEGEEAHRMFAKNWAALGIAATATSLLAFVVEYFPKFPPFRVETNNILYAFLPLAGAALIAAPVMSRVGLMSHLASVLVAMLGFAYCVTILGLWFFGPESLNALQNMQMRRLHGFISEFQSLPMRSNGRPFQEIFLNCGILPLLALGIPLYLQSAHQKKWILVLVWLCLSLVLALFVLGYLQVRWLGVFVGVSWCATAVMCNKRVSFGKTPWLRGALASLVFLQGAIFYGIEMQTLNSVRTGKSAIEKLSHFVLAKRVVEEFKKRDIETNGLRVLCTPNLAPPLYFYGGIQTVMSFYWENVEGLAAAVDFGASKNSETSLELARTRKWDYLLIESNRAFDIGLYAIKTGDFDAEAAKETTLGRLLRDDVSIGWARPYYPVQDIQLHPIVKSNGELEAIELRCWALQAQ